MPERADAAEGKCMIGVLLIFVLDGSRHLCLAAAAVTA